jgi:hypothetical protein
MSEANVEMREARRALRLPVRVQGFDADGAPWDEMTITDETSLGGVSFHLQHAVATGEVVLLSLPLPKHFRRFDLAAPVYRVHALVRTAADESGSFRVGALFLGKEPPRDFGQNRARKRHVTPSEHAAELSDRRRRPRLGVILTWRLRRSDGEEEQTVTENLGTGGARVVTTLPVRAGEVVFVEELGGTFQARAEVRGVYVADDQAARLNLRFLSDELTA